jgi:hypothetical protein
MFGFSPSLLKMLISGEEVSMDKNLVDIDNMG